MNKELPLSKLSSLCPNSFGLIGVFNIRTKNKDDYDKPDDNLLQLLDVFDDQELQNYMCDFETLVNQNVPLQRISLDIANPNEFEHKLLNFCKQSLVNKLHISVSIALKHSSDEYKEFSGGI
jgi:hypothetical protein